MVSYILITGYSIVLFMNPLNFVAVILKLLLINLLAALNFANVSQQEAQLSPRDRAMRLVSSNLANYHATVQKLLIRQALTKPMV